MCLAVPGVLETIVDHDQNSLNRMGRVNFSGIKKEVSLAYVPEAKIGDYVIVHVGFAISIVNPQEAQKVFEYLKSMGELEELSS